MSWASTWSYFSFFLSFLPSFSLDDGGGEKHDRAVVISVPHLVTTSLLAWAVQPAPPVKQYNQTEPDYFYRINLWYEMPR